MSVATYLARVAGRIQEVIATVTSSGAGDAGSIVALGSNGKLDPSVMPVGIGADTSTVTASENLAAGALVDIFNASGTANVRNADASTTGKEADGFVLSAVTSGQPALVYFEGRITGLSGLTPGARYYLSDSSPGGITDTPVSGTGKVHQFIGVAIDDTSIAFEADDAIVLA